MNNKKIYDFTQFEALRRYLGGLKEKHVASLEYYFGPKFAGFYHKHEKDREKMSKSSTATCVVSLARARKWQDGPWKNTSDQTVATLLKEKWTSAALEENNPFTVAFVLEAVSALDLKLRALPDSRKLAARRTKAIRT